MTAAAAAVTDPPEIDLALEHSVGVTGTRDNMPPEQEHAVFDLLVKAVRAGATEFHHGACTGMDAFTHYVTSQFPVTTHVHPATGVDARYSAMDRLLRHVRRVDHEAKPTAERNQDIVDASGRLIAAPKLPESDPASKRSGTWQTIRKARAAGKPVTIVDADGNVS